MKNLNLLYRGVVFSFAGLYLAVLGVILGAVVLIAGVLAVDWPITGNPMTATLSKLALALGLFVLGVTSAYVFEFPKWPKNWRAFWRRLAAAPDFSERSNRIKLAVSLAVLVPFDLLMLALFVSWLARVVVR